ncbi:uncharacterized protein LOC135692719 isoform X2 [Rhopilema esculentum]|uniref:uncharacterized protein LOC135692719 isoform X2 n=1 Tax=Rhopilema esculentum TaxID=499914 RepID=UPI0031CF7048
MVFASLGSLFLPFVTSIFCVLSVYVAFIWKQILKEAQEKSKGSPNIERLKQCLPLTISASWKLGNIVNGIPIWENHVFSSEADNGVIAAQAVINAPAESVIKEMVKPRMLQMLHPWVSDTSLAPGTPQKQLEQSEVLSDCLSVFCNVPSIKKIVNIYVKWKNCCLMKRRWKYGKDNVSWLVMNPEYKVYQHLFGHWQCCLATDIPTGKDTMCLLSIFTAPTTDDETRLAVLGAAMASQVVNMREHMDSLYLKKIVRKDSTVIQRKSSIEQRAKSPTAEKKLDNKEALQSRTVPKNFAGVEGIGYVEAPAEIKDITEHPQPAPAIKIESQEAALRDAKLSKYKDTLDTAFELLVDVYNANETTPGWTYLGNRNGIEVYRLQGDASCPSDCFKGTAEVNVPLTYALQYVTEINFKKEWDDVFNEGKVIEDIDEVTKVTYMEYKPVWPTTARDFCSITATRHLKGDIYGVAVKATTHPSCPPVKGKQRGEIITGGFVVEGTSIDPPQCKVTYVTRADLKGKIPASMVNKVNEKQPMYTAIIRDKIEERFMYQDPPHEGDTKIIAARQYPSILEASTKVEGSVENQINSATSTLAISNKNGSDDGNQDDSNAATATNFRELSKDEIESFIPDTDVKWDAISETSVTSLDQMEEFQEFNERNEDMKPLAEQNFELPRDRLGNLDFKVLGNQTAAKLLEEVLLAAKVDSTSQPADGYTEDIWTYQGTYRNVMILRKIHTNSNFYSFLGRGIIDVLPVTVWEAVKNPSTRFVYDNMLKKTSVAKDIEEGLRIIHMRHETTACFIKQARDFVILTKERVDPNKYIMAGASVEIPECPLEKNCIRGTVLASGWIIEPVLNKGKPCSLVTYLSQVDFGGKLPVRLINLIAKRQPMSIAYIRTYLEAAEHR